MLRNKPCSNRNVLKANLDRFDKLGFFAKRRNATQSIARKLTQIYENEVKSQPGGLSTKASQNILHAVDLHLTTHPKEKQPIATILLDIKKQMHLITAPLTAIPNDNVFTILSFLSANDLFNFTRVNKQFLNTANENPELFKNDTIRVGHLLTLVLLKVTCYESIRDKKYYGLNKKIYLDEHSSKIDLFRNDIEVLKKGMQKSALASNIDNDAKQNNNSNYARLSNLLGYSLRYGYAKYLSKKQSDSKNRFLKDCTKGHFYQFPFGVKDLFTADDQAKRTLVKCEVKSIIFAMLWRLAFEYKYAVDKNKTDYQRLLVEIAQLFFNGLPKKLYIEEFKNFISNYELEYLQNYLDHADCKDLVYVWQGYYGYEDFNIKDSTDANKRYNTGRETKEVSYTYTGMTEEGGDVSGTRTVVIKPGIKSDLKYFYLYRDRRAEGEIIKEIFCNFVQKVLSYDLTPPSLLKANVI